MAGSRAGALLKTPAHCSLLKESIGHPKVCARLSLTNSWFFFFFVLMHDFDDFQVGGSF